jgi:hypothetical protein
LLDRSFFMTTIRSTRRNSFEAGGAAAAARLGLWLGGACAASLLTGGCDSQEGQGPPTDNSRIIPDAGAVMKFCHSIKLRDGKPVVLTVEFGAPPLVRVSAETGTCSTPVNIPCTGVPAGVYPGRLLDGTALLMDGIFIFNPGDDYLLTGRINGNGDPTIAVTRLPGAGMCAGYNFFPSDGGADGGNGDGAISDGAANADAGAPDSVGDLVETVDGDRDAGVDAPAAD